MYLIGQNVIAGITPWLKATILALRNQFLNLINVQQVENASEQFTQKAQIA